MITDEIIIEVAAKISEDMLRVNPELVFPKFKGGWVSSFKARHGFKLYNKHGEAALVDLKGLNEDCDRLIFTIQQYEADCIYNMDETRLFYQMEPNKSIAQRQIQGAKKDKIRITIALTCNATGEDKLEPLIIGKYKRPRPFKKKYGHELGFNYHFNPKAWMNARLFREYLIEVDKIMLGKNKKILLLVDNAPSHIVPDDDLTNVKVKMLPPNTTTCIQPLDQGIIAALKARF